MSAPGRRPRTAWRTLRGASAAGEARGPDPLVADFPVSFVLAVPGRAAVAGTAVAAGWRSPGSAPVIAHWVGTATADDPMEATYDVERAFDGRSSNGGELPWATGRARRAAAAACRAGVEAIAAGCTVRVELPEDEAQAVAACERLDQAVDGPLVCVLAGAWGMGFLAAIERAGAVHAAGPPAVVAAARETMRRHGVIVRPAPRPTGAVARSLLAAGWAFRALVRAIEESPDEPPAGAPTGRRAAPSVGLTSDGAARDDGEAGQALLLMLLGVALAIVLAGALAAVALALGAREEQQRAVDIAALAAAARLRAAHDASGGWTATDAWRAAAGERAEGGIAREQAADTARKAARENGVTAVEVGFPSPTDGDGAMRVRVRAAEQPRAGGLALAAPAVATAEVAAPAYTAATVTGDEYAGPLATRQGRPMRPDVALAFDRMNADATVAGHPLTVTSGFRSNAEQARLFAAHPDPKWVARPGTSLHRLGTELDLGPASAYGWLAANAERFGFRVRYQWEPWHVGFVRETASAHVAEQGRNPTAPQVTGTIPPWVPAAYRDLIRAASIRFKVSAALLSAQLKAESDFDPRAVSTAGARGIAQFMPGTAAAVGLRDPHDPVQAIPAQAQLMAGLLRRFGSVPLALAAYNAGEGRVAACGCVPAYPETQRYVARIIALMRGFDDVMGSDGSTIRLVG